MADGPAMALPWGTLVSAMAPKNPNPLPEILAVAAVYMYQRHPDDLIDCARIG